LNWFAEAARAGYKEGEVMRLLYLYPEEWHGHRAREVHTLSTCVALARNDIKVTLVIAGGLRAMREQLRDIAGVEELAGLNVVVLARGVGPLRSAAIFGKVFRFWFQRQPPFQAGFVIHLKAAATLKRAPLPYLYEAHEVFAEMPRPTPAEKESLHTLEGEALAAAAWRVATSKPLAAALRAHYVLSNDFFIVPNAGPPPLPKGVFSAEGPFVYAGSIADWKGLDTIIAASRAAEMPLKIVGGTAEEWQRLSLEMPADHVAWQPRVPLEELPRALAGARAGLIPTRPDSPSGRYSCPMKLFDYAACGLPVLTTALQSLESLNAGSWCARVESPTVQAWTEAMRNFRSSAVLAETARAWASVHTWKLRAEKLASIFKS
jgi:glycosyltransferase involved in cell wall biosynthesis